MKAINNIYKFLFIIVLISSCSPQKKLAKLLYKNPNLINSFDTTIYFETNSVDTSFIFSSKSNKDTFIINDTKTRIFRYYDTLRIEQDKIRDSVIVKTHEIINVDPDKGTMNFFDKLLILLSLVTVIFVSYKSKNNGAAN
jgi:hypothetical protein